MRDEDGEAKEQKDPVKAFALKLLADKYGIEEEDFLSAELEVVPAGRARDLGFDRSMVLGYGQDDSVCAYTSLVAQLAVAGEELDRTAVCVLVDKEEIGSVGATGMASQFFENTIAEIMELAGEGGMLPLRRALAASAMLSSDVSAGFDPAYASVFEAKNSAYLGHGLVFNKYTGARGKCGQQRRPRRVRGAHPQDHGRRRRTVPNLPSWARSTPAAAGPSPTSPPSTAWTSSTPAWRCCPCTAPGRPPAKPTSTRPSAATRRSCAHNKQ